MTKFSAYAQEAALGADLADAVDAGDGAAEEFTAVSLSNPADPDPAMDDARGGQRA